MKSMQKKADDVLSSYQYTPIPYEQNSYMTPMQQRQQAYGNQFMLRMFQNSFLAKDQKNQEHEKFSKLDIWYEHIAQNIVYEPAKYTKELNDLGYDIIGEVNTPKTGFYCFLLEPKDPKKTPILAFRGSDDFVDWIKNLDFESPGYSQFYENKDKIANELGNVSKVDVVGHSLGGALAQYAALEFTGKIKKVMTFQAPGIEIEKAQKFKEEKERPEIIHHISEGDVVDLAGTHLDGTFYKHDNKEDKGIKDAHTRSLLSKGTKNGVEKFSKHPNPYKKALAEGEEKYWQ